MDILSVFGLFRPFIHVLRLKYTDMTTLSHKSRADYIRSRKYAYFLTSFSVNNADAKIMLHPKLSFSKRRSSCYRYFLSDFTGIYYRFWLTGCEFIHKSLLEKYRGHIFTIIECQLVYFCIFLKAYWCFVRIQKLIVLSALQLK